MANKIPGATQILKKLIVKGLVETFTKKKEITQTPLKANPKPETETPFQLNKEQKSCFSKLKLSIDEGVFHLTEASSELPIDPQSENGIWVMEIESPPNKADLVRMKDEYGRSGKAYEGTENMVFDPSNCLKFHDPEPGKIIHEKFNDCIFILASYGYFMELWSS